MPRFTQLSAFGFRNLKNQQPISFDPKLNFFIGENGSGKSNLIEALHFLSHSRSFRGAPIEDVIRTGEKSFTLAAKLIDDQEDIEDRDNKDNKGNPKTKPSHQVGVYRDCYAQSLIKIDGKKLDKYSDLAQKVPVKTLSSDKANLLDLSPKQRRQEIDWQLFHVKHENLKFFAELNLTLKNKNALLKNHRLNENEINQEIEPWNAKLAKLSVIIYQERIKAVKQLSEIFNQLTVNHHLKLIEGVAIGLISGYPKSLNPQNEAEIFKFLSINLAKEMRMSQSLYGPQRSDLIFYQQDDHEKLLKIYCSRGQKKLLSLYFSLAQILVLKNQHKNSIFLLDDIHSELDSANFNHFIKLLSSYDFQCMITVPKKSFAQMKKYGKTFAIKNGLISGL